MRLSWDYIDAFTQVSTALEKKAGWFSPNADDITRVQDHVNSADFKPNVDDVMKQRSLYSRAKSGLFGVKNPASIVNDHMAYKNRKFAPAQMAAGALLGSGGLLGTGYYLNKKRQQQEAEQQASQAMQEYMASYGQDPGGAW